MATGIKDKVAILGMGCSRFGERWDTGTEALLAEAFDEALLDAGIERDQIEAAWFGSCIDNVNIGNSAIPASTALRLDGIPVSRMENMCATGTEALRGAAYAVASGAVDIALAIGAEKLKDTGYGGLPTAYKGTFNDLWLPLGSAPAGFAQLAAGYRSKYGTSREDLKKALAHVSWKSHQNGVHSPKAHLRKEVSMDAILNAPMIAEPLGLYDCCGVSDGAAAAIVTTPEIARALGKKDLVTIKAIQLSISSGIESTTNLWDGSYVRNTRKAAERAYKEAGITNPREQLSLMEVHDCFSITELVTMEDLGVSRDGGAVTDVLDGFFDRDGGGVPCQVDGGLKCFGHPIGASGLRMAYENYSQLLGRAGERQLSNPSLGLSHNLGGVPYLGIAAISILGLH
ncbi:acetyl-CoA acetyltransferase [Sphingobium sp. 22B]|uniref:acetyl-CoA acetyltransferase n=1 Tax=unclassified Sphingobium TaxID=2611147 RepID=UPI000782BF4D|nr:MULTISPECIES: acetyl-CoA acetyltransferase [unclassified Sphingobium]KXU33831.1 acetyl-CoA acetyltransferase [Sphingobium sp. AM]KYC33775.1 acetyl-CoA acetyltransferase [Sphingobium sp. 22B]OAP33513.1 acetyl-CoA acetyltransferase [Sphingobium sp. 20006FA]